MRIGPCIIVTVEEQETNLMSLVITFYLTSSMLNMFRTLIHPSSEACDFSIVSPLQHTSKQEHTINVVIKHKSRRLLMMDVLMSETCLA